MNLRMIFTIFKKEIIDIARDKRALLISVIIPVVMFPLSFGAMSANLKANKSSNEIRIAFIGKNLFLEQMLEAQTRIRIIESSDPLADLEKGSLHAIVRFDRKNAHENIAEITVDNLRQPSIE